MDGSGHDGTVDGAAFIDAVAALYGAADDDDLCAPFLAALPVTGAAISTLDGPFGSEIVCASDAVAARLDEVQIDFGEGPSWEAMLTGTPVLEPDVARTTSARWPMALLAIQEIGLAAVFAFPMRVGALRIGSVDLYNRRSGSLGRLVVQDAIALTDVAARQVLHRALVHAERDGTPGQGGERYSRREVHQATGMVAAQAVVSAADALLLLRADAYTNGCSVRERSRDVIARRADFTDHDTTAL